MTLTSGSTGIDLTESVSLDEISLPFPNIKHIKLSILRLDRVHPVVSGNKWFKLKENLQLALNAGASSLLTFGGAYSNHLLATAAAARGAGLHAVGIVRGLHGADKSTPTLQECAAYGMQLYPVSRDTYRLKTDVAYLKTLSEQFPGSYIIPEGGHNAAGIAGAEAIARWIPATASHVLVPVGSGTTMAGLGRALPPQVQLSGICAMKGGSYLQAMLATYIPHNRWSLITDAHEGGFARYHPELIGFMNSFFEQHQVPLDFVYTAKMMKRVMNLIEAGFFPKGSHLVCVHTGGLQGNRSIAHQLTFT